MSQTIYIIFAFWYTVCTEWSQKIAVIVNVLLSNYCQGADVDTHCVEYENGTALHIAASNLSLGAARYSSSYLRLQPLSWCSQVQHFILPPPTSLIVQPGTALKVFILPHLTKSTEVFGKNTPDSARTENPGKCKPFSHQIRAVAKVA